MNRLGITIVLTMLCLLTWTAPLWAAASVDGFVGVPWGANSAAVTAAMTQRGFAPLSQTAEKAEFQGQFADEPANLTFYFMKDRFFRGEAELLKARNMDKAAALKYFEEFAGMLQAKYGKSERVGAYSKDIEIYTYSWYNLPAAAQPPGQAGITISGGQFGKKNAVIIDYSISTDWVKTQYLPKDI